MMRLVLRMTLAFLVTSGLSAPAFAQSPASSNAAPPMAAATRLPALDSVGVDQHLNAAIPLDLTFSDEQGRQVRLGDYFSTRPVVLILAYYSCPMLCTFVLNGALSTLQSLRFDPGDEFEFVAVSIDPSETPALAASKRRAYVDQYVSQGHQDGVHFLTGSPSSIAQLTRAIGFRYTYVQETKQFAHPALMTVLTPAGRISRYLYGIDFPPADVRLALVEAGQGKVGGTIDRALLYCYHYDAANGRYGVAIFRLLRLAGVLTLAALGAIVGLTARGRRRRADPARKPAAS